MRSDIFYRFMEIFSHYTIVEFNGIFFDKEYDL